MATLIDACWKSLSGLRDDWDGYFTPAPTAASISEAAAFFEASLYEPDHIAADTAGGVGMTFWIDNFEIVIEFLNTNRIVVTTIGEDEILSIWIGPYCTP